MQAEVVCMQETWVTSDTNEEYEIDGFSKHFNSVGAGKGIATFFKSGYNFEKDVTNQMYQMTQIRSATQDIINVYRSSGAPTMPFLEDLKNIFDVNRETLIIGDFNVCFESENDHSIFKTLLNQGFKQLIQHPTHTEGRTIDLVFIFSPNTLSVFSVDQQAPYFTDHDILKVKKLSQVNIPYVIQTHIYDVIFSERILLESGVAQF